MDNAAAEAEAGPEVEGGEDDANPITDLLELQDGEGEDTEDEIESELASKTSLDIGDNDDDGPLWASCKSCNSFNFPCFSDTFDLKILWTSL